MDLLLAGGKILISVELFQSNFDLTTTTIESRSVGFEPTTSGFGDPRSTELN